MLDPAQIVQTILMGLTAWGLLRFVRQVDELERRINECCGKHRRTTDKKPARRR